jgi:YQGE family putative transporter
MRKKAYFMQPNRRLQGVFGRMKREIPAEKRLSKDAIYSLTIHSFFQFGASMSGVFLNLYLWRLTHSLWISGMYYIISWTVAPLALALGGWIAKRKDRMYTYRAGLLLYVLFYLAVILAQERVVEYYVGFAIFTGFAGCFYWTGYLTLMYDVSNHQNRIRYLAINMIMFTGAGLVGPALAGFVISRNEALQGYIIIFALAFAMFLLAGIGSFRIKALPSQSKSYYLKYTMLLMRKNPDWVKALFGFMGLGVLQGSMLFLPPILLFQVLSGEEWVGYFGVLFSGLTMGSGYFISRFAKESRRTVYFIRSAVGFTAGSLLLLWAVNFWTVIGFMIVYSIFSPLQGNTMTSTYYGLIGKLQPKGQFRVESVVVREIFVNIGRVFATCLLLVFASSLEGGALAWMLCIFSIAQFSLAGLMRKYD